MAWLSDLGWRIRLAHESQNGGKDPIYWLVSIAALFGMVVVYVRFTATLIEINDAAGYLYGGVQIAETGVPSYEHPYNQLIGPYFTLSAFRVRRPAEPRFYLMYPPGYPVIIAIVRCLLPSWEQGVFYVAPITAVAAALGVYLLGQTLHRPRTGLWAALLVLMDPVTIANGTRSFSDTPALACILLGYASLIGRKHSSVVRGGLAGFLLGYACLIRYTSVIALAGLALWAVLNREEMRRQWQTWLSWALVFIPLAVLLLLYNVIYFGGPLNTGYALQHHWIPYPAFSWQYFLGHSPIRPGGYRAVLETVAQNLGIFGVLAASLGGITLPRRASASLGLVAFLYALIYAFYAWPASGNGSRFVLPVLAILRLFAAAGFERLLSYWQAHRHIVLALGLILIIMLQGPAVVSAFTMVDERNTGTADRVAFATSVASRTDERSVFISRLYGDHLILYGHRAVLLHNLIPTREPGRYREEEFEPGLVGVVDALLHRDIPVYVIDDGLGGTRVGFFDPLPVLRAHFSVVRCPDASPPVYRVRCIGAAPPAGSASCWK